MKYIPLIHHMCWQVSFKIDVFACREFITQHCVCKVLILHFSSELTVYWMWQENIFHLTWFFFLYLILHLNFLVAPDVYFYPNCHSYMKDELLSHVKHFIKDKLLLPSICVFLLLIHFCIQLKMFLPFLLYIIGGINWDTRKKQHCAVEKKDDNVSVFRGSVYEC